MTKNIFFALLSLSLLSSCAKKTFYRKDTAENPGYYSQWFNEHKNEKGEIPNDVVENWVAFDKSQIKQERGAGVISKVTNLATTNAHGGRTRAILVSSLDSTRVFVGSVSGGLWRSDDSGDTWTAINDQASNLSVTCITENPFNPKEIYYGSGEVRGGSQPAGNGIYKSVDGGLTFNRLPSTISNTAFQYCNYIEHSRVDSSTIWVGTSVGLFVSRNSGETWTRVTIKQGLVNNSISGIISFPDSSLMVSIIGTYRIFKSKNGKDAPFETVPDSIFPKSGLGRVLIANCKSIPSTIYAFFTGYEYLQQTDRGVFRSDDSGLTWKRPYKDTIRVGSAQQAYCQMLMVSPVNPNYIMIGGQYAAYSLNGGLNWETLNTGHADNHIAIPTGNNSNEMFMGNDGGIYKNVWKTLSQDPLNMSNGYTSSQYYAGNYAPTGRTCIGGTQDNGTWRYVNGVLTKTGGGDGAYSHISQQEPNTAYYATQNGSLYRKDNYQINSAQQITLTPKIAVAEGVDFINEYQINYADGKQLYYRTNKGIWRSIDKGKTFKRLNKKTLSNITAIGVTNAVNPIVYLGGSGIFYRIDSAATRADSFTFINKISKLPQPMRSNAWGNISFHPSNNNTMFVGLSSMTAQSRVFKGTQVNVDSMKWYDITGNLPPAMSVYQVQAHPDSPDSVLLAATAFGLYYTLNGGKNWLKETRVPNVPIFEMKLRAQDKSIFLFTHGRGVWYLELEKIENPVAVNNFIPMAWKIYPNPTSNLIQIEGKDNIANIQLFNLEGKEMLRAENVNSLDISILPKGVYLMKIFNEKGRFSTQKIVKE